jgi:hypothetical protein
MRVRAGSENPLVLMKLTPTKQLIDRANLRGYPQISAHN